jgi:tetratricopeptide (TPR) repeat protein
MMMMTKGQMLNDIAQAKAACNYQAAIDLTLLMLQSSGIKKQLSAEDTCAIEMILADCYSHLHQFDQALMHARRNIKLVRRKYGFGSFQYATSLWMLCIIQRDRGSFVAARKAIMEAASILVGTEHTLEYGGVLVEMSTLDQNCGLYELALENCNKAKIVLEKHKDHDSYRILMCSIAMCHHKLMHWSEAYVGYKEAILITQGYTHADMLSNMAVLMVALKQYEEGLAWLALIPAEYGDPDKIAKDVATLLDLAARPDRGAIDVEHNFRMCNWCKTISEHVNTCPCVRAWYCNAECQVQDWPTHKPNCSVCIVCDKFMETVLHCSSCKKVKYCGPECSKAHWPEHKQDCT